jgi:dihydropyrimidinase
MEFDYVFKGGRVTTTEGSAVADLGIVGEKIAAIGNGLRGRETIDAAGLLVLPGAIDPHTHFGLQMGPVATVDDYESGTRAAAFGGITSFVNYAFQEPGRSLIDAIDVELAKSKGRTYLDFGFHVAVTRPDEIDLAAELPAVVARGVTSLKIFTAVEGWQLHRRQMLDVMSAAARLGLIVNVHSEDGPLAAYLTKRLLAEGKRSVNWLPAARPPTTESLSITMVTDYAEATGCSVYIVHLASKKALETASAARARGVNVFVETRPVYLYLDRSRYDLPGVEGNKYASWPPLRTPEDQAALWNGLASGTIQTYGTDHVPWPSAMMLAPDIDFSQIPGGASNVETSVGMLYAEGVAKGRISLRRFVELTSANPARIFGMAPAKGSLAIGSDADVMLIDPGRRFKIITAEMQSRADLDPYDGFELTGWPVLSMARGEIIVRDRAVHAKPGRGRWLNRQPHQPL